MSDEMKQAKEEMKRVDHLIHVSLKYTRTVDVFRSIIQRMADGIENAIAAYLETLEEDGTIESVPEQPGLKVATLRRYTDNETLLELAEEIIFLRRILRAEYGATQEFRRHVTMSVEMDGETEEINIDNITERYKRIESLINEVENIIQ